VTPGAEVRVGRDAARCTIVLVDSRVSGVHAALKLEHSQLFVRDEGSTHHTVVDGAQLQPGVWTPARHGGLLKFGPLEFTIRYE
jgi:pSer/pThr/pTyr-binding forkhead associated (FHA) protein